MLFSKSCVYGLRAALYLASNQDGEFTSIRELSDQLDISFHFLTKILQQLTEVGIVESKKGPKGGVRLIEESSEIVVLEVVVALDGTDLLTECALGLPGCGSEKPCPIHDQWADTRDEIRKMLSENTLFDLAQKGKEGNLRITANGEFKWA